LLHITLYVLALCEYRSYFRIIFDKK